MNRWRVNQILAKQKHRRRMIITLFLVIIVISFVAVTFLSMYFEKSKINYVTYKEDSNIEYEVFLRENDTFETDSLGMGHKYIASLINYIEAEFNYSLKLDAKSINYNYTYRIDADIVIKEESDVNSLYEKKVTLVNEKSFSSRGEDTITINESLKIDYNYYNDMINKIITQYELKNVESVLNINMYVNAVGSCEGIEEKANSEVVSSLVIPLAIKTISIDVSNNIDESENNLMICSEPYEYSYVFLILSFISVAFDGIMIYLFIKYIISTKNADTIYERELNKILNNYRSYIQKIESPFDFEGYQVIKIDSFTDLLEIRDTIQAPILMAQSEEKKGTFFIIPSPTKLLYIYCLKVSEIEKKLQED